MRNRLLRTEQVERNRELVIAAARRVFLAKGYVGASLDAIAEEAGFSKGVVYSQFDSKADLFLTLLERRIDERAEQNERLAAEAKGAAGISALLGLAERASQAEPEWALLVIEFRVHAARDRELNRRYAELHGRTVERLARVLAKVLPESEVEPRAIAEVILAMGTGLALERIARPGAISIHLFERMVSDAAGVLAEAKPARIERRKRQAR